MCGFRSRGDRAIVDGGGNEVLVGENLSALTVEFAGPFIGETPAECVPVVDHVCFSRAQLLVLVRGARRALDVVGGANAEIGDLVGMRGPQRKRLRALRELRARVRRTDQCETDLVGDGDFGQRDVAVQWADDAEHRGIRAERPEVRDALLRVVQSGHGIVEHDRLECEAGKEMTGVRIFDGKSDGFGGRQTVRRIDSGDRQRNADLDQRAGVGRDRRARRLRARPERDRAEYGEPQIQGPDREPMIVHGLVIGQFWPVLDVSSMVTLSILSPIRTALTASMPLVTCPKTVYCLSRNRASPRQM